MPATKTFFHVQSLRSYHTTYHQSDYKFYSKFTFVFPKNFYF
jgi:hypothetical protein